jgi:hypothetical protein
MKAESRNSEIQITDHGTKGRQMTDNIKAKSEMLPGEIGEAISRAKESRNRKTNQKR